jgi:cold shock CspA family protein
VAAVRTCSFTSLPWSALGLAPLNEGATVEYELAKGRNGKESAENLRVK